MAGEDGTQAKPCILPDRRDKAENLWISKCLRFSGQRIGEQRRNAVMQKSVLKYSGNYISTHAYEASLRTMS